MRLLEITTDKYTFAIKVTLILHSLKLKLKIIKVQRVVNDNTAAIVWK